MIRGVCLVGPGGPGGVEVHARRTAAELRARGRRVRRLDPRGPAGWSAPLWTLAALLRLGLLAAGGRVDALHLMTRGGAGARRDGLLLLWARALGLRTVLHHLGSGEDPAPEGEPGRERGRERGRGRRRGPGPPGSPFRAGRSLVRRRPARLGAAARAAHLHLVAQGARARALAALGVDPARIRLLREALPERLPHARPRPPGAPLRVLFLAPMTEREGAPALVAALIRLAARGLPVEAVFAGEGPARAPARRAAARAGLEARFPGRVDEGEAAWLMRWADLLVHPSARDRLPAAILEALRVGLPVAASPTPAIAEALPDGAGLRHLPSGAPAALADGLAALARDAGARRALGAMGRRVFEARFRIEDHVDALECAYGWKSAPVPAPVPGPASAEREGPRRAARLGETVPAGAAVPPAATPPPDPAA